MALNKLWSHWYSQRLSAAHHGNPQLGVPLSASTWWTKLRGAASVRLVTKGIVTHSERHIL